MITSRVALCGKKEVLLLDLSVGPVLLPIPEPSGVAKVRDPNHNCTGDVLVASTSPTGRYCVAVDDSKRALIFDLSDLASPSLLTEFYLPRRPSCCAFSKGEDAVLIADKSGDVFRVSLIPPFSPEPSLLLGHLSIVTDLQMCPTGRLLATADRDEKVRLSRYPNSYNIAAFLLGHHSFVCRVAFSPCGLFLCSAGGDGRLLLWNVASGEKVAELDLNSLAGDEALPCGLFWADSRVLVVFEGRPRAAVVTASSLEPAGEVDLGAPVCAAFRCGPDVLVLTSEAGRRLVLLRTSGEGMPRVEEHSGIAKVNSEHTDRLANAAEMYGSLSGLKKAPVDRTGLDLYNERKQEIKKNVLARRTRHMQEKAKRQRQGNGTVE